MPVINETTITSFTYKGVDLSITEVTVHGSHTRYNLAWNDGVANAWTEVYLSLPVALARVASLVACEDDAYNGRSFPHDKDEFTIVADAFLYGVTR